MGADRTIRPTGLGEPAISRFVVRVQSGPVNIRDYVAELFSWFYYCVEITFNHYLPAAKSDSTLTAKRFLLRHPGADV